MRRAAFCLLGTVCGYALAAVAGAFVSGPLGAILGVVAGFLLGGRTGRGA
jgi:hypothetical protein